MGNVLSRSLLQKSFGEIHRLAAKHSCDELSETSLVCKLVTSLTILFRNKVHVRRYIQRLPGGCRATI